MGFFNDILDSLYRSVVLNGTLRVPLHESYVNIIEWSNGTEWYDSMVISGIYH